MQTNIRQNTITFGEKYPLKNLLSCACQKPFMRKSDGVNLATSILKLTKAEKKEMMRSDTIFQKLLRQTGEYILSQKPELKFFVNNFEKAADNNKLCIISKAEEELGKEIDIKRYGHQRKKRWII